MITTAELHRVADRAGLRFDQAEKDYIILWLLSGLAHSGLTEHGWIFKGGTCLRHCYYEGYRFSEDIDFSCRPDSGDLESSLRLLDAAVALVLHESGIRLTVGKPLTAPGDFQIEIPVEYTRGGVRRQGLPQVKVHLTFDEPVLDEPIVRSVEPALFRSFNIQDHDLFQKRNHRRKIEIIAPTAEKVAPPTRLV